MRIFDMYLTSNEVYYHIIKMGIHLKTNCSVQNNVPNIYFLLIKIYYC